MIVSIDKKNARATEAIIIITLLLPLPLAGSNRSPPSQPLNTPLTSDLLGFPTFFLTNSIRWIPFLERQGRQVMTNGI